MNEIEMYVATLSASDGTELTISGNIMQCANWADNMIRVHSPCEIRIVREDN